MKPILCHGNSDCLGSVSSKFLPRHNRARSVARFSLLAEQLAMPWCGLTVQILRFPSILVQEDVFLIWGRRRSPTASRRGRFVLPFKGNPISELQQNWYKICYYVSMFFVSNEIWYKLDRFLYFKQNCNRIYCNYKP